MPDRRAYLSPPDRQLAESHDPFPPRPTTITTPTSDLESAPYGTPDFADAIAPVWGMTPEDALALMQFQSGDVSADQYDLYTEIKKLEALDRAKEHDHAATPRPVAPSLQR